MELKTPLLLERPGMIRQAVGIATITLGLIIIGHGEAGAWKTKQHYE